MKEYKKYIFAFIDEGGYAAKAGKDSVIVTEDFMPIATSKAQAITIFCDCHPYATTEYECEKKYTIIEIAIN